MGQDHRIHLGVRQVVGAAEHVQILWWTPDPAAARPRPRGRPPPARRPRASRSVRRRDHPGQAGRQDPDPLLAMSDVIGLAPSA